jgi:predicted acylesterase/phospholipase RssA/CRP-like cAMP-binding protein
MNMSEKPTPESDEKQLTLHELMVKLGKLTEQETDAELQLVELKEGQVLFEQGDEADSMYLLVAGVLGVRVKQADDTEVIIDKLAPGAMVGELGLLAGQKRTATVYAVNDVGLIRLTRSMLEKMSTEKQSALAEMEATVVERWQRLQLTQMLGGLFGGLDTSALHAFQEQVAWQHLSNGDVIFRQGDPADGMYIVVNGRLQIIATTPTGKEQLIGEVSPGETVGEFGLLTDKPRSATVYAIRETQVAKISASMFKHLIQEHPAFMGNVARVIVERQQRLMQGVKPTAPTSLTLALLPAHPSVEIEQFSQELATALRPFGSTLVLSSHVFDARYGQEGVSQKAFNDPSNADILSWMSELEAENKYLVFAADPKPSPWTQRCINQADRVLVIANPNQDPAPGAVEQLLAKLEVPVRTELVLWHPNGTDRPLGAGDWLDARPVHTHHHVRRGDPAHMARLARRLTGHAIALVLSGGGARGFAHLGVHRALEELKIPIDYIGATSMGAVIGGSFYVEQSNAALMRRALELASRKTLFDYTLPFTALMASQKVTHFTQNFYGDLLIEDLWHPFFCVASNLSTAEPVVYQRGPLWRAIRASLALPGVFTPVMEDGEVLIDGSVMDNFPIQLMADLCESEQIIGVNIMPHRYKKRYYDLDTSVSGWRILWSRINPFSKPIRTPSLIGTMLRATEINSVRRADQDEALADVMIYPDVKRFSMMDYESFEDIVQAGYDAALGLLRAWWTRKST